MPQPSYAYACARISALEKSILSESTVRRLAESGLDDVMRQLMDVRYGGIPDAQPSDCERMIENERVAAANTIAELSPAPELTNLFLLQTDVQNLKALVKARLLGSADAATSEGGLYSVEALREAVQSQDYRALPEPLAAALARMEQRLRIAVEPQIVSVLLDYGYLDTAMRAARDCDEPFIRRYFAALCDFDNVLTFLRMRAMGAAREDLKAVLLPEAGIRHDTLLDAYELSFDALNRIINDSVARDALNQGLTDMASSGNIGMLEKTRDDYLLSLVNEHRHDVLTIFPIVGYWLARDREAKAVRLLISAKRNGLDDGVIVERLRALYG